VPFTGRGADDVAGVDFPGVAAGWLVEAAAFVRRAYPAA
jgi:hypothetical protein